MIEQLKTNLAVAVAKTKSDSKQHYLHLPYSEGVAETDEKRKRRGGGECLDGAVEGEGGDDGLAEDVSREGECGPKRKQRRKDRKREIV